MSAESPSMARPNHRPSLIDIRLLGAMLQYGLRLGMADALGFTLVRRDLFCVRFRIHIQTENDEITGSIQFSLSCGRPFVRFLE
jgi:hypothetical protein